MKRHIGTREQLISTVMEAIYWNQGADNIYCYGSSILEPGSSLYLLFRKQYIGTKEQLIFTVQDAAY